MKSTLFLFIALLVTASISGAERRAVTSTNTIHLTPFTLRDQHDHERKIDLPQPRVFVLTVADRKGSEQIEPWVRPLKERYGEPLLVQGIADMSAVPKLLRPTVRKQFKKDFTPSVMLDWEGQMTAKL